MRASETKQTIKEKKRKEKKTLLGRTQMAGAVLSDDLIQVYVRVRAPADASASRSVDVDELGTIVVTAPSGKTESFEFDRVGGEGASQEEVFVETAKGIADGCLAGYNGTVLCYGQTGAGKTFTMHGPPPHRSDGPTRGLLARVVDHLFAAMTAEVRAAGRPEAGSKEINYVATVDYGRLLHYNVTCSFLEIYNEELTDLLCGASDMREGSNPPRPNGATPRKPACPPGRSGENSAPGAAAPLRLREDADRGVYVANLTCLPLANVDAAMDALSTGVASRAVGVTAMNKHSSRSHAVFSVQLHQLRASPNGKQLVRTSQLHLVDLAGSERAKETGASGTRLKESCKINCSLSVLSKVITQLVESRGGGAAARAGVGVVRVAYRESKLTHLLRDSLGGDSRTCIIANVTSSERSHNETLSTLRFAARAKAVRTRAVQQKVRQLEESSDVSHLQWWPATAEAPESASERHSKKLSAGRAEPKIGVAELEAECEALRHALGLAEHALCDREAEAEAERERHCAELAEAEAGRARAEEEARAQRAQIESERVQEARAAEKRARFEAEEQSDRAASQAVAAAQSSQVAAGLRDKLREAQGEVQAERGRRAKLGEALARAEAERDEARQLAARQQQLAEGHAAQVATAARLHSVEVLSLQRSRIKAVAALEEALRRSGKGAEADAVRRELRRLESLIGGASTLGGETNAAHGPGSTSRSPAAGSTTPGPRPRPSQPKRGHKLGSSPAARTPLSPAKPNSAGRHPASADKARPGSHRAATAPTSSVQTPSSSRQDPMVVSRILELGRVGVSVHEILATLTAEDYRCSNGAPWGRAQADGRVVVRVLLQHSVAPVIVDDDKLKGYAEDYAARLRSGEAGGAPQERLAVAERPGGGRVNGSRAGGAPSWTALAPASPS
jgi:hypothetical protein